MEKKYEEILESLQNVTFNGELTNLPKEIVARMMVNQAKQGNKLSYQIFENNLGRGKSNRGFNWSETPELGEFWSNVLSRRNLDVFYKLYPKENPNKVIVSLLDIADWKECEVDDIEIVN